MKKDNNRIKSNCKTEAERLKNPENEQDSSDTTKDHFNFTLKLLDSNPDLKMRLKKLI